MQSQRSINMNYSPHKIAVRLPSREVSNKYSPLMGAGSFPLTLFCDTVQQSPASMQQDVVIKLEYRLL